LNTIANQFLAGKEITGISPYGSGHINDTFLVETNAGQYLLQRVNHAVFKDVEGLTRNIIAVTTHLRGKLAGDQHAMQVLNCLPARDGRFIIIDAEGNFWRVLDFVNGSHSFDRVPNPAVASEGGRAYGWFVRMLHDFPAGELVETIPGFHDAASRIGQFEAAVDADAAGRLKEVHDLADSLLERSAAMRQIYDLGKSGVIPVRVTHNDTKINNVLFNKENIGICVIDLDTVMPGYVHFDFGDAIRTFANASDEDERILENITFNMDFYHAFTRGYLGQVGNILNEAELATLGFAPRYITYEQTIRFLTDFLQGDTYYKIKYPGHNLVRARAQFRLLTQMEMHAEEMDRVIRGA
jgi:Ser/Thr protein kinase RdoA (MazF antagonist)